MKTIGLLGGLPWQESLEYYQKLNENSNFESLLFSFDYQTMEGYRKQRKWETISKEMIFQADQLKAAGADYLIICSDIYHKVYYEIKNNSSLKMLHRMDALGRYLVDTSISRVLLLAHKDVMHDELYQEILKSYGIEVIIPSLEHISLLERTDWEDEDSYLRAIGLLESYALKGMGGIVISDSQYHAIKKEDLSMKVFSSLDIHVNELINYINKVK